VIKTALQVVGGGANYGVNPTRLARVQWRSNACEGKLLAKGLAPYPRGGLRRTLARRRKVQTQRFSILLRCGLRALPGKVRAAGGRLVCNGT
jgi:hypothetical protein